MQAEGEQGYRGGRGDRDGQHTGYGSGRGGGGYGGGRGVRMAVGDGGVGGGWKQQLTEEKKENEVVVTNFLFKYLLKKEMCVNSEWHLAALTASRLTLVPFVNFC